MMRTCFGFAITTLLTWGLHRKGLEKMAAHGDASQPLKLAVVPRHRLSEGSVDIQPNDAHACSFRLDSFPRELAGDTTSTDPRSRRVRESRKGRPCNEPDAAAKVIALRKRLGFACRDLERAIQGWASGSWHRAIVTDAIQAYARLNDAELEEKARAAIAALKDIAPRNAREALIARRMLALDESLQLARKANGNALLSNMYVAQATALSRSATALSDAIERMRGGGQQRVVIRHVHVYKGGKAIVGQVSSRAGDIPPGRATTDESPSPLKRPRRRTGRRRGARPGNVNALKHRCRSALAVQRRREVARGAGADGRGVSAPLRLFASRRPYVHSLQTGPPTRS
jgi:hypothetical protein